MNKNADKKINRNDVRKNINDAELCKNKENVLKESIAQGIMNLLSLR